MDLYIRKHFDFKRLNSLLEEFNRATGFVTAILDLEGNVLSKSGWREICTNFHRVNKEAAKNCKISDTVLANNVSQEEDYCSYRCLNGLTDVVVPIVIKEEHFANLFAGQFFFEEPSMDFFKKQAKKYNFDESLYLAAVKKVPVLSETKVEATMSVLVHIIEMVSDLTVEKLELEKTNNLLQESYKEINSHRKSLMYIIEGANVGTWEWNVQTGETVFNEKWAEILGYALEEISPITFEIWREFIHPDDVEKKEKMLVKHFNGEIDQYKMELRMKHKDGQWIWIQTQGKVISWTEDGKPEWVCGTHQNITKRKKSEKELKSSEGKLTKEKDKLRTTLNSVGDAVISTDIESMVVFMNPVAEKLTGWNQKKAIGKSLHEVFNIVNAKTRNIVENPVDKVLEEGVVTGLANHTVLIAKDGNEYQIADSASPIINDAKEITGVVLVFRDVTKEYRQQKILQESKNRYQQLFKNINSGVAVYKAIENGEDFIFKAFNKTAERIEQIDKDKVIGKSVKQVFPGIIEFGLFDVLQRVWRTDTAENFPISQYEDERITGWRENYVYKLTSGEIVVIYNDITERKKTEEKLKVSEKKFRSYVENAPEGIFIVNEHGKYIEVNKAACNITGYSEEELLNLTFSELIQDEYIKKAINHFQTVAKDGYASGKIGFIKKSGERRIWNVDAVKLSKTLFLGFVKDITEQEQVKEALQERVKELNCLYSLSELAKNQVNLKEIFQAAVEFIQVSWKYPMITRGKIIFDDKEFLSKPFEETPWKQLENIIVNGEVRGTIETYYLEERPELDEGPFMKEERNLIEEIAKMLGEAVERKQAKERLKYKTFHDELTGLYNRIYFNEEIKYYDNKKQLPLSFIMGDINGLKIVNDTFGHKEGDKIVKRIAQIIENSCREKNIAIRLGGDEFVVLLPQTSEEEAEAVCIKIKDACEKAEKDPIRPSIALGYATKEEIDKDFETVLKEAEDNMYKNKVFESSSVHNTILGSLKTMLREISNETLEHSHRMEKLSVRLGSKMSLSRHELYVLSSLAELHDLGKIGISKDILQKTGPLNSKEWEEIKRHPEIGYKIAMSSPKLSEIAEGVLCHHERWDGDGYPQGLKGEEIPLLARIISIVDAYDVMTRGRPYKGPISKKEALEELKRCAGSQFDPDIVDVFINKVLTKSE